MQFILVDMILTDKDVSGLSYSITQREYTSNLCGFAIGGHPNVTDGYFGLLFDVISKQCPSFKIQMLQINYVELYLIFMLPKRNTNWYLFLSM